MVGLSAAIFDLTGSRRTTAGGLGEGAAAEGVRSEASWGELAAWRRAEGVGEAGGGGEEKKSRIAQCKHDLLFACVNSNVSFFACTSFLGTLMIAGDGGAASCSHSPEPQNIGKLRMHMPGSF